MGFQESIMDVSAIAAAASANAAARVQAEASVRVLKMAMDMQAESALQLLEAIPAVAASAQAVGSTAGGVVDTWA
jgi:hypothetical protein